MQTFISDHPDGRIRNNADEKQWDNPRPDNPGAMMRLSPHELDAVRRTLYGADPNGRVWLFGSRADDSRRGGDIDIYLEASQPMDLKTSLALEYRLTSLCDAKVDLLVRRPGEVEKPIHVIARQGAPL